MTIQLCRAQLLLMRNDLALGAKRLLADPSPSTADAHLAAQAILAYVTLSAGIETAEAGNAHPDAWEMVSDDACPASTERNAR
jgi:hypothetical protein